jgi:4-amino-4-deoxy-L-arabinose transferase-like glycosyltransferase
MVFAWTSRLYGYGAGCAALIALAVSPYFALIGHLNLLDAGFTFWVSGTVFAFTLAQSAAVGSPAERRWMGLSWAAAALAVLSKGLAVGVLVGLTLVLYSLIERDVRVWRRLHVGVGLPLFLALAAPWFLAVSWRNAAFPEFFFVHEHFVRFLTTVHQRTEPWWYFGPILLIGVLPWLGRALGTVRDAWVDSEADQTFKPLKFLALFSIVTVLFFSLSGSKLAPYILPAIPPLAALAGARVSSSPRFLQRTARASGALLLLAAAGLALYTLRRTGIVTHSSALWLLGAALAGALAMFAAWRAGRPEVLSPLWMTVASAVIGWQCLMSAYAESPPAHSAYGMLRAVRPVIRAQTQLFSLGQYRETLSPYLGRTLSLVDFTGELEFGLTQEPWKGLSAESFLARWNAAEDAVAFLDPNSLDLWRKRGLQGRVIAADAKTVAVSRL